MKLRQLIIGQGSPFVGKTLEESGLRQFYNCMVVGLEEGRENLSPFKPTRRFEEGDIIWVVGEQDDLRCVGESKINARYLMLECGLSIFRVLSNNCWSAVEQIKHRLKSIDLRTTRTCGHQIYILM